MHARQEGESRVRMPIILQILCSSAYSTHSHLRAVNFELCIQIVMQHVTSSSCALPTKELGAFSRITRITIRNDK